jgi:hypothetical protein
MRRQRQRNGRIAAHILEQAQNAVTMRLHRVQPAHQHIKNPVPRGTTLARNGAGQHGLIHHPTMQQQKIQPRGKAFPQGSGIGARFGGQAAHCQPRPAMRGNHAP